MKLIDWLKVTDIIGLRVVVWGDSDRTPLFEGNSMDIPWYIAEMKLTSPADLEEGDRPISYRTSLDGKDGKAGFVICVDEEI